ncbi:MAG: hypothetical protein AAF725_21425 [Acidobacteriota bacterium]
MRIILVITTTAAAALTGYMFRTDSEDNPHLGIIYYKYRWGRAYSQQVDSNRDGRVDAKVFFAGEPADFSTAMAISEIWEDRDYDGIFEVLVEHKNGEVTGVRVDTDRDGQHDRLLSRKEMQNFFKVPEAPPGAPGGS